MKYRQDLSFIATLSSTTEGFEGQIDSVEYRSGAVTYTRGDWLTLTTVPDLDPQRFWFGCYEDGNQLRFEIRTFTPDKNLALHYKGLALSHNQYVGLYTLKPSEQTVWQVRASGGVFDTPTLGMHHDITLATTDHRPLGPSQPGKARNPIKNCYVRVVTRPFRLALNIERNHVPLFDSFASNALPDLYE